jgi:DNA modification methylase
MSEQKKVSEVVFREDLYPRIETDAPTVQRYVDSIDKLPPVQINQHNELIDGWHRWTAHRTAGLDLILCDIIETQSDVELLKLAISSNSAHGKQMSNEDKKSQARKIYSAGGTEKAELEKLLSVTNRTLNNWLSDIDQAKREERKRTIEAMWLACFTEQEIADKVGVDQKSVHNEVQGILENVPKILKVQYQEEDWNPPLFNIWSFAKKSNSTSHFGNTEQTIVDNLLYLYTDPGDIVIDPFAGGGATIDICKTRKRRYWVADRAPIPAKEKDIRKADIKDGTPPIHNRWSDVSLTYLDPPYWKQAENKYSQDAEDLANMEIDEFYKTLVDYTIEVSKKQSKGAIALIIQPTQWNAPRKRMVDHVFDIVQKASSKMKGWYVSHRVSCPYSSEQYTPQMVNWAKENKQMLILTRELIIWERENDETES